jgi:hypothetical protein
MKYEDLKYLLKTYGYNPVGREDGDVIGMDNGRVRVIFHRKPGYGSSGNAYRLVCGIPGKKYDILATSNRDIYTMNPDCYFCPLQELVKVLTGDPTKIVKKFKDLYMNSLLDEVLG